MLSGHIIVILIVLFALGFDFINGFHDTANAIATVVSTRVLAPRTAIVMAAVLNLVGAVISTKVAQTVSSGLITPHASTQVVILSAVLGAIVWNLITWRFGIPSSSTHALIGGLCGAALVKGGVSQILWHGLIGKVVLPLFISPLSGFVIAYILMIVIYKVLGHRNPGWISSVFRKLQIVSAAAVAFSHGSNDAQKSMGIITLALISAGLLHGTGNGNPPAVPLWVILSCAVAMAAGTSAGGWRIIQTMGHRIIRLEPVHGFVAETAASIVIFVGTRFGIALSTTHVISGSIFGVGASKRLSAVRWGVAQNMVIAWILTLPAAGLVAAGAYKSLILLGLR